MITREHCIPYVGQRVVVQTTTGVRHDGILHSVTRDGIYMRRIVPAGAGLVVDVCESPTAKILQDMPQNADDLKEAFFPFLFFPFFALAALGPWGWGPWW